MRLPKRYENLQAKFLFGEETHGRDGQRRLQRPLGVLLHLGHLRRRPQRRRRLLRQQVREFIVTHFLKILEVSNEVASVLVGYFISFVDDLGLGL